MKTFIFKAFFLLALMGPLTVNADEPSSDEKQEDIERVVQFVDQLEFPDPDARSREFLPIVRVRTPEANK